MEHDLSPTRPSQSAIIPDTRIKWGYTAANVPHLPRSWREARGRLAADDARPCPQDIVVARVVEIAQHTRIDLCDGSKSTLFEGDLLGIVLSARYATRRFEAEVPGRLDELHFVCSGGVCGRVTSVPPGQKPPTILEPLGYLHDGHGSRINLRAHAATSDDALPGHVRMVVVTGSSMDSGKTTSAASVINGLARTGQRVAAAKVTGTASINDLLLMRDAGAVKTVDFTTAGFASTAGLAKDELVRVLECLLSQLATADPDTVVLEFADSILQPETAALLDHVSEAGLADAVVYACTDALGVRRGVDHLQRRGLRVAAVSGTLTSSPLGIAEAEREISIPVLKRDELRQPAVARGLLERGGETTPAHVAG